MKSYHLSAMARTVALIYGLALVLLASSVLAQNTTTTQGGSGSASQTTNQTTTTTTSAPSQTTQTQTTTWVDPIWFVIGGVVLLAIILIAVFASRGRSRDRVDVVQERETVVKKD